MKVKEILKNLTLDYRWPFITSIEEGVKKLNGKQRDLEAIHIYIELLSSRLYPPKKRYFNISKIDKPTKLDEWIFKHLVEEAEYKRYLDKYSSLKDKLRYSNIDEYILNKHYRPKAIRILSKKKLFNLGEWVKRRFGYRYERKSNITLKEGIPFRLDFRNSLESIFILKKGEDKQILGVGGSGSSGQRMKYTMFTAIFYLLGKKRRIRHHLLRYNSFNKYEYFTTCYKPIVTWDLGSNYPLDEKLRREIMKNGITIDRIRKLCLKSLEAEDENWQD